MRLTGLFLIAFIVTTSAGVHEDAHRLNYGILFQRQKDVQFSSEYWIHTWKIDVPSDTGFANTIYLNGDSVLSHLNPILFQISTLRQRTQQHLTETRQMIFDMVPESKGTPGFNRRALLPFVGQISRSLFGLATENDIRVLASHMNVLIKQQNQVSRALARHGGDFSSYINQIDGRISNLMTGLKENSMLTRILASRISNETTRLKDMFEKMTSLYGEQLDQSQSLERYFDRILTSIALLMTGKISPRLIPPSEIKATLNFVQTHLAQEGYHVVKQNPQYYYEFGQFTVTRRNNSLFVAMKFPICSQNVLYKAYKILSYPVPINDTSNDATMLTDVNDFFIISSNHQFHTSLDKSALTQCVGTELKTCKLHPLLKSSSDITCEAALFLDDKVNIKSKCNFRFLKNTTKPHILELPKSKILIYQTPNFTLRCKGNDKLVKGCSFCIMAIPCQCQLITEKVQFNQKVKLCKNDTRYVSMVYPVNLALLQQFFNDSQLRQVVADTAFNLSIDVKIPPFKLYEHKMSKIFADDNAYSLNLKKMAKRAKKDQVIFSNLAESLIEGEIDLPDDSGTFTKNILSIIALVMCSVNLMGVIWLIHKVKILGGAILIAKDLPKVNGFTLQYTIPTTTEPPSWSQVLSANLQWDHLVFALSIMSFAATILLLYRHFRTAPKNTRICLEISTGLTCEIVEVLTLPLCPSYFNIRYQDTIAEIKIVGMLFPKLQVQWPQFQLININTDHTITVPSKVQISWYQAYKLRTILEEPYCAHVIILHHDIKNPIPSVQTNALLIPSAPLKV